MLAALALLAALAVPGCGGEVPLVIRDEMTTTSKVKPGAVTIVFFTDFQCPFCRRTHMALAPIALDQRDHVRVVLRHVPLRRHPDARSAARAAICVERLSRGELLEDYAQALFESQDLSEGALEDMAIERGIDKSLYERCVADPSTEARIEQDTAMFDAVKGDGVPLLFVGRTRLDGAQTRSSLEAAVQDAASTK